MKGYEHNDIKIYIGDQRKNLVKLSEKSGDSQSKVVRDLVKQETERK